MFYQTQTARWPFLSLMTLTGDLQAQPSEGPNTSSMGIWRKSVQWFPRYFTHKPKKTPQTDCAKNRTLLQFTACGKNTQLACKTY